MNILYRLISEAYVRNWSQRLPLRKKTGAFVVSRRDLCFFAFFGIFRTICMRHTRKHFQTAVS